MLLRIKDKTYPLPGDNGQQGVTGAELVAIEDHFKGLDGMELLTSAFTGGAAATGYTRVKGLYALAWVAMSRGGEIVSLADVLNDYAVEDLQFEDEPENPSTAA